MVEEPLLLVIIATAAAWLAIFVSVAATRPVERTDTERREALIKLGEYTAQTTTPVVHGGLASSVSIRASKNIGRLEMFKH
jgi:hypothetical protein